MVHYQGSRYSVPPAFSGRSVRVETQGGMLRIVAGEELVAEHRQALKAGQSVVAWAHLAELWKITNDQIAAPQETVRERWHLLKVQSVEQAPLSLYEEAGRS